MIALVAAPATTANLGPGFDVLGAALDLEAAFALREGPSSFVWPEGMADPGEPNLFLEAFAQAFQSRGARVPDVSVEVARLLPLRSGLGSSAAAICAGLRAADAFLDRPLDEREALRIAVRLEGHPDNVAACLYGGVTIASAAEETLVRRLPAPNLRAIALYPGGSTSTPRARARMPASVPRQDAVHNIGRAALLVYALLQEDYGLLRAATEDRLHEEQRIGGCDWCTAARMAAYEAGALAMPVSGSGPTMLALAQPHAASAVRQALEPFTAARPGAFVLDLGFTDRSARLEAL